MIIAIASGKGGTGKTTVSTNLALSIDHCQFLDCDVEEPNANIFLNIPLNHTDEITVDIPTIDKNRCNSCGTCSNFCVYNALAVVPSDILVFPELCHSCGGCELVCPQNAVGWKKRVIGKLEYGRNNEIDFYQGMLDVGELQAIPIIKALKRKIDKSKHTIIDVPPGTSCPVIESISGSDYCILVTEPTPFGLHDLKLAVELIRHMGIPFGVIINRDGIGDKTVEAYCQKENITLLLKIPEQKQIAHWYSKGNALVQKSDEWHEIFRNVFNQIQKEGNK